MIKKTLYIIAIILFFVLSYMVYDYFSYTHQRNKLAQDKGLETTQILRDQVNTILSEISNEGARLAKLFGSNDYTANEIEQLIKESSLSIKEIQGVTACYEPYAFADDTQLYCPYYNKGSSTYIQVEDSYDYSVIGKGTAWYTGVRDHGAKWVEPYFAKAANDWYVDYGIPFYYNSGINKGKIRGTITMSFVCSGFKDLIHNLSLGKTGYGLITSTGGTFLAHPINEYVGTAHIDTVIVQEDNPLMKSAYQAILEGNTGNVEFYDEERDDNTLFYYDKIPASNWGVGLLFYKNDLLNDGAELNQRYIRISLVFSAFLLMLLAIFFNKDYLDRQEIWILSILTSVLLIANIVLVTYLQHTATQIRHTTESPPITDFSTLDNFVSQQHERSETLKTAKSIPVPTGIYVQRMEFEDSYNLNVGGTIWQKYPTDIVDSVKAGFTLPQLSPFAEASYIEESYRKIIASNEDEKGHTLIGWDFRVTLRLNFKYADFPLDKRHINIEIMPLDNSDNLIFVPDLESYSYTNPTKKSGLNHRIEISGSEVLETYFNYSIESYDADFGFGTKELFEKVPVLHYNVKLRRKLLNAFVTYLIPILVVLIMMFILINSTNKTSERQGVIESMAAFAFVLVFSHIDMRKEIVTADLIYIEFFYFATYFLILAATHNLMIYSKSNNKLFNFNDNQIFKVSFFPIFFLIILVVTLAKFY